MDNVWIEICTDRDVYLPGQSVTGSVFIFARKPIAVDSIKARLYGDAVVHFLNKDSHPFENHRVFVDQEKELWHYSTLQEMLGMTTLDFNANRCEKGYLTGKSQFRFTYNLPDDLATSFNCPGSPVHVKYSITVTLNMEKEVLLKHEQPLSVLATQMVTRPMSGGQKVVHSRCFSLPKDRSVFIECALDQVVLSPTGKLQATITVINKWKQSIKYVHINIVRKIEAIGLSVHDASLAETNTFFMDTTGVGLPSWKRKIAVGETYAFSASFNVPALPPNMQVDGLLRTSYFVQVSVGRAHNFVIAALNVPLTIVTDLIDMQPPMDATECEDLLIDLTPASWTTTTAPSIDLLA
ncbi:hypothetical protein Q1695_013262 [Nippostrongylus brasiliensis]|nr:hypothetical protein Q1695_013262 [Nippostrongylus brasiliensis]